MAAVEIDGRCRPRTDAEKAMASEVAQRSGLGKYERTAAHRAHAAEVARRTHTGRKNTPEQNRKIGLAHTGPANTNWTGGRHVDSNGYVKVWLAPEDRTAPTYRGYISEHRKVMQELIGRPLLSTEEVHHKNGIRDDNRPENLELRTGPHGAGATKHCPTCTCCEKE